MQRGHPQAIRHCFQWWGHWQSVWGKLICTTSLTLHSTGDSKGSNFKSPCSDSSGHNLPMQTLTLTLCLRVAKWKGERLDGKRVTNKSIWTSKFKSNQVVWNEKRSYQKESRFDQMPWKRTWEAPKVWLRVCFVQARSLVVTIRAILRLSWVATLAKQPVSHTY